MNKKINFVCLLKEKLKDNVKPADWVGHSQLISLDTYDLFKRTPNVDEKQASVTGNTIKQSVSRGGKNTDLLQEEEENVSEETNDDANVNTEANKVNDDKKDLVFTMKEENKTLKKKLDIENIASKKITILETNI